MDALDALLERAVAADAPGVAIGIWRPGEAPIRRCRGLASLAIGAPVTPATVFSIASMTKMFVALLVLSLERDGLLSTRDPLRRHLPDFPDYAASMPLIDLMRSRAGLRDTLELQWLRGLTFEQRWPRESMLETLRRQAAPSFAPGSRFLYSNAGWLLLAMIAERVGGADLDALLRARVFAPLGMRKAASVPRADTVVPGKATGHWKDGGTWREIRHGVEKSGEGSICASLDDLLAAYARFGGEALPGIVPARDLAPPHDERGGAWAYGAGLVHERHRGLALQSHSGLLPGWRAQMLRFEAPELVIVVLGNRQDLDAQGLAFAIADLALAAAFPEPAPARVELALLARLVAPAAFVEQESGALVTFAGADPDGAGPRLAVTVGGATTVLERRSAGHFVAFGGLGDLAALDLSDDTDAPSIRLHWRHGGSARLVPAASGTADAGAEIVGDYASEELGVTWMVRPDPAGGGLCYAVRGPGSYEEWAPFRRVASDRFCACRDWAAWSFRNPVRIERDAGGAVTGFSADTPRARGVRFHRVT